MHNHDEILQLVKIIIMSIKAKNNIDIEAYLSTKKEIVNNCLNGLLSKNSDFSEPNELWETIRYSLLDAGKRFRAILCLATYEALTEEQNDLLEDCLIVASSIETIHAMSLIHDDLPSMDNDDLRRGKPSCHKAFGEANAILAGDAMLGLSVQLIIEETKKITNSQKIEIINTLCRAFTLGLVPGQVLDLNASGNNSEKVDLSLIEKIYTLKTAELIKASVLCGAYVALSDTDSLSAPKILNKMSKDDLIRKLSNFGLKLGIAFQIIDDVLDATSDTKTLGKTSGKDEKQKKATYPMNIGIESSRKIANELILDAKNIILDLPINKDTLLALSNCVINRIN